MLKKIFAYFLIILGSSMILYSLMVLMKCFSLLSSTEFNSEGIVYSLGTLLGPLLLMAIARWMIRKGIKIIKQKAPAK